MVNRLCSTIRSRYISSYVILRSLRLKLEKRNRKLTIPLQGWFIFTTLITLLTLKSTVAFFSLFFFVDIAILLLALGYLLRVDGGMPNEKLLKAGGLFAILGAFLAWYNAFAGIADSSNSFFLPPVVHFPWSEKKRSARRDADKSEV